MGKEITSGSNFSLDAEREAEITRVRQNMRGFFDRLTPEQQEAVMAYDGDDMVDDPLEVEQAIKRMERDAEAKTEPVEPQP